MGLELYDGIWTVSLIDTEPVNSCLSFVASPNLFEPDEKITEDEINVVCNSVVVILPATLISVLNIAAPLTIK